MEGEKRSATATAGTKASEAGCCGVPTAATATRERKREATSRVKAGRQFACAPALGSAHRGKSVIEAHGAAQAVTRCRKASIASFVRSSSVSGDLSSREIVG